MLDNLFVLIDHVQLINNVNYLIDNMYYHRKIVKDHSIKFLIDDYWLLNFVLNYRVLILNWLVYEVGHVNIVDRQLMNEYDNLWGMP